MPNRDGDSNSNSNSNPYPNPSKPERPPLLKKFKTIPDDTQFPGPLFPAVRRISTSPPSSHRSSDSEGSIAADPLANNGVGFSDRDWLFPSFLGPHAARKRVSVKASKSLKHESSPHPAARSNSMPANLDGWSDGKVGTARRIGASAALPVVHSKPKLKAENELKSVPVKAFASSSSSTSLSSANLSGARTVSRYRNYWIFYLLKFTCIVSVCYVICLLTKVAQLQEENISLRRHCSCKNVVHSDSIEVLKSKKESSFSYFGNSDNRAIALYAVLFTLITPFVLYKYLDHLPRIKNLTKRTNNKKEEVSLKKRIAYMVDVCFSVYPYAKLLALLLATVFLIGFGGLALYAVSEGSFSEALWLAWTFVADSGNHADRVGAGPRIVSVSISSGGMLIFAMMLGLVSDAISEKVDSLRKGKSEVIESNHILILGWSDKLGSLLKQLAIANKSLGGGVVVVLAERDKEEMEMDIAKLEFDFMGTSVICRSGSPLILADLKKVSVSKARAIIVLASDENADQSDARALRVVLSLAGVKEGLKGHVVVEMSDLDNEPLVKLVGGELVETVVAHDVIGRLMIQCALQPGLAQIWEDILGFENAEFYIKRWPQLDGMRFEDVLISFPDAVPCGIKVAADGGKIIINPDDNYVLKEGDEVLVIAEDDDTYAPGPLPEVRRDFFPKIMDPPKYPEKILFCGWRRDIDDMILVLEAFLAPDSELWMFNDVLEKEREKKLIDGGLDVSRLENIKLVHREGNTVIRRHLEALPLETFDSILILADESVEDSIVHSDSRSLATLLLIRDIQGNEMCIKPAEFYLYDQEELCFYDIMIRGRQRQEIVIGYRPADEERAIINPLPKSQLRKWSLDDVFIVIASEE
ncbi:ion channel POLLUX isoform X2 [Cornus florida]|uniref:ion channel POLLUX isoform X2 n=1 Tax=Cornus florida TaxID=4283 RepID=UPI00289F1548|nr:ion channel POLLUX isoform X2 [Cornus florida]